VARDRRDVPWTRTRLTGTRAFRRNGLLAIVWDEGEESYSLLASIEDMSKLGRLGEANLPGTTTFGTDIFTAP
jgi:hypothetical protein